MPTKPPTDAELEAELKLLLGRHGIAIPADRMAGLLAGWREILPMLELVRRPRTAAAEPANVYALETITRSE